MSLFGYFCVVRNSGLTLVRVFWNVLSLLNVVVGKGKEKYFSLCGELLKMHVEEKYNGQRKRGMLLLLFRL